MLLQSKHNIGLTLKAKSYEYLTFSNVKTQKLNQFIKSLKKINQKKWKKLKINEKLKNYKKISFSKYIDKTKKIKNDPFFQ